MKQSKTIIGAAFMVAFFWGIVTEACVWMAGKIATPHGWLTITVMVVTFLLAMAGIGWLTSETR